MAFYLLGAAILHAKELRVENSRMIETLSYMYRDAFGEWSMWVFIAGAIIVLFSSIFGATASNARLFADALALFGLLRFRDAEHRIRWVKVGSAMLPAAFTGVFLLYGSPVHLVFWGAVAQALMLPFIAVATLYFHYRNPHSRIRARTLTLICVYVATGSMMVLGLYQVVQQLSRWLL
ncbi:MAG: hypothetical protein U1F61_06525 [Opitutaceae bacterium]